MANVTYQVYAGGRWLPNVTNLSDYAGIYGTPIQGVYANLDKGSIQYRTHTQNGDWLPWVSDRSDYAGILGKNVDGIQMKISGLSGYNVKYRAYVGGRWLPWVVGLEDYAGIFGQPIEGIQVEIVSGNSSGSGDGDPVLPPVTGARKVFIDPGHGGSDPGAIGNGLNEKDVVLSISKKVGNILTQNGISVAYSRTSDTYVSLEGRAQQANSLGSSLFVSIHANSFAGAANGTECYTYPSADAKNKELSRNVSRAIANKFGIPNRGHKEEDFAVLRLTNMPAILVETAFISNASDANLLRNRQDDFATAIANEIIKYFGAVIPNSCEHLVISASEYEPFGGELPGIPDRYKYNFIEPAINQLNNFKNSYKSHKITWLISRIGYSDTDILNFIDTAKKLDVNIAFFNDKSQLIKYINSNRAFYKIKNITFFSHGIVGSVELGYNQKKEYETELSLNISDIKQINSSGFDSNAFTMFYSCNTATSKNGTSFANEWFKHELGTVKAAVNKTSYYTLLGSTEKEQKEKLEERKQKGYSDSGSVQYPGLAKDAYWLTFI